MRHLEVGQGRRPRAWIMPTRDTRAASGLRPAGHYEPPARSWLTIRESPNESAARRRSENAAVERRKASIPIARDARRKAETENSAFRRSIPSLR